MGDDLRVLHRQRGAIKHKLTNFLAFLNPIENDFSSEIVITDYKLADLKFRVESIRIALDCFEEI